jgi:hypothetical protein
LEQSGRADDLHRWRWPTERWGGDQLQEILGQAYLVSRLQVLLGTGRLHLPTTREARVLTEELLSYELRVDELEHERSGGFKVGKHDHVVTALGLAVHADQMDRQIKLV